MSIRKQLSRVGAVALVAGSLFLAACGGVSESSYEKIRTGADGTTLSEAKSLLGSKPSGMGIEMNGKANGVYTWKDGDKSITVTFKDDRAQLKAKSGF
jgi:hypothetical protein